MGVAQEYAKAYSQRRYNTDVIWHRNAIKSTKSPVTKAFLQADEAHNNIPFS